jgi:hypothetical protein
MDKASWLAMMREAGAEADKRRVGRGTRNKGRLLDDGDQNIGNADTIVPFPSNDIAVAVTQPISNPTRLLALDSLSPTAQTVTVGLTAAGVFDGTQAVNFPTPITAIVEIGNGSVFTRIEVDVPVGRFKLLANTQEQPDDGVVFVNVPAGTLRVYARNDSKLIVPNAIGTVGTPALAPGAILPPVTGFAANAFVKAFAVYYPLRGHINAPTRSYYIGRPSAGGGITYSSTITEMYAIPPLAKRFRILRSFGAPTTMPAFSGDVFDANIQRIDSFAAALNVSSPWFDLPGSATFVGLNLVMPAVDGIVMMVFEIGA